MSKYVYLLILSIALGFTMFTFVAPRPASQILSTTPPAPHTLILDSLPVEGAPLTGVVSHSKPWFQLPDIPFSPKTKETSYAPEEEEHTPELDLSDLNLSVLDAILGMFLSVYQ